MKRSLPVQTASKLTAFLLALSLLPAQAHHSVVMFNMARESVMRGTIKDFQWTNPHTWLLLQVTDSHGGVQTWSFEGYPPSILSRMGLKRSQFPTGERVTVHAFLMKDGSRAGLLGKVVRADGTELDLSRYGGNDLR